MIDERLIVALAREFGNVALDEDAARAVAADATQLGEVVHRERRRLAFEDAPQLPGLGAES